MFALENPHEGRQFEFIESLPRNSVERHHLLALRIAVGGFGQAEPDGVARFKRLDQNRAAAIAIDLKAPRHWLRLHRRNIDPSHGPLVFKDAECVVLKRRHDASVVAQKGRHLLRPPQNPHHLVEHVPGQIVEDAAVVPSGDYLAPGLGDVGGHVGAH